MIGRINSTYQVGRMNQTAKRKAEGGGWWFAGGISPANCVAAYQAKGAASYAASKVNLANAGTYNLADIVAPSWSAGTGWMFNGTNTALLASSYTSINTPFTVLVRGAFLIDHNTSSAIFAISRRFAGWNFKIEQWNNTGKIGLTTHNSDLASTLTSPIEDSVIGVVRDGTNLIFYKNDLTDSKTASLAVNSDIGFVIGGGWNGSNVNDFAKGNLYALAYYHTALSALQIAAVKAAMNLL